MGFISEHFGKSVATEPRRGVPSKSGRETWQTIFATHKERSDDPIDRGWRLDPEKMGGGSMAASVPAIQSIKRLLSALRSNAPGGWSDDRYEQTRHWIGITYVAGHAICKQLSQCEFAVFRKDPNHPDGKRPVTRSDPPEGGREVKPYGLVDLLSKPNAQDGFGKLMYRWGQQKILTGMALTWMVPNALGVPYELYCIPTATAIPQPTANPMYPNGYYQIQPIYPYGPFSTYSSPASSVGAQIPAEWIVKFLTPHPFLRYEGYSALSGLRLHLDEVESIDRSRWYSMKRGVNPCAVLNFDNVDGMQPLAEQEIARIHAEWESNFQGPENAGKLIVSTPGGRLDQFGAKPVDMDFQSGWEQLSSFCMGGFGITKPAAGMVENSSYSTLFATLKQLSLVTIKPECDDIAADLTRFLAPFFGDDLIVEIRSPRIDDHEQRLSKMQLLIQSGSITKNELRRELDMPLTPEDWGDDIVGDPSPNVVQQQTLQGAAQPTEEVLLEGGGIDTAKPGQPGAHDHVQNFTPDELGIGEIKPEEFEGKGEELEQLRSIRDDAGRMDRRGEEPPEARNRPKPKKLGRGAKGPNKAKNLNGFHANGRM